ncbi:hypothetical protein MC7420_3400 [Coleofasciculus chthonoplastes PCC 7420]|uniref:Uncharacterized protein n=1 Tax=Coleofasciculus chthonoplastes PCC 7420 TaxID=118168 RepID=B4W3A4_9CYAN|nr:hypothetical protein MC7420_3400 [Coleofasciculus chthonoplastes PCC 7420]
MLASLSPSSPHMAALLLPSPPVGEGLGVRGLLTFSQPILIVV